MGKRLGSSWHRHAAPTRAQALAGLALPVVAAAGLAGHSYTVRPGDTLSGIAQQVYGNAGEWRQLYAANRGTVVNANEIFPGQVLTVPGYQPRHAKPDPAPVVSVRAAVVRAVSAEVPSGTLGCSGLERLWEAAGGADRAAVTAASVAMAESGGRQYALSPWGDVGYWQINAAAWGPALATYNALGNARAAIRISGDGTDWEPWTTFTSGASAGRC